MRVYKEKQYLIFQFDDGKNVKYNFANGETIGKNNRIVKSLSTQLRGYSIQNIINSIEDENYRTFIEYVNKEVNRSNKINRNYGGYKSNMIVNHITNVGSLLAYVNKYANKEQYFACGLKNIDLDSRSRTCLKCSLNEIPKGLIKLCKQYDIKLNQTLLDAYRNIPNLFSNLLDMKFNSITKGNIIDILKVYGKLYSYKINQKDTIPYYEKRDLYCVDSYLNIKFLVEGYNYDLKSLLIYLDNLMTYEAIDSLTNLCRDFYDYVIMANKISNKFEKYPRYFLSTHQITCRNYDRLKETFIEQDFSKRIDEDFEYQIDNYKFIYPKYTQDIKDEAVQQSNCVASYIQRVIDGECHIMFLRKQNKEVEKDKQYNQSLVTLEIRDYKVVQARGKFNRCVTDQEQQLINKFDAHLLKIKNKREKILEVS